VATHSALRASVYCTSQYNTRKPVAYQQGARQKVESGVGDQRAQRLGLRLHALLTWINVKPL
jgi:hypothetical protein